MERRPARNVLSLAEPNPQSRYVKASAREFSISLGRDLATQALLAIYLGDAAVPLEHGGPVRLIVPGADCLMNIKWLDHLELRSGYREGNRVRTIGSWCRKQQPRSNQQQR